MLQRTSTILFTATLLAGLSSHVAAAGELAGDDPPPPPPTAPAPPSRLPAPALRLDLGLGSPVGALGLVYSRPVAQHVGVEAGVGLGFSGVQLSVMGKLRIGGGRWRFTPGVGISLGVAAGQLGFTSGHPGGDVDVRGNAVTMGWLDVDAVGVEYRGASGFVFAASGGATIALSHGHWDSMDLGGDVDPGDPNPQLRVGLGWVF